ncbi:MAG: AAA family ATPase [Actinobacteria bacterium]|nr:AAA family ATPase [Actinomycetota bacterium]
MTTSTRLADRVQRFVAAVTPLLEALAADAGLQTDNVGRDVLGDAAGLVSGLIAADGVVTDAELLAMIACFGELDDPRVAVATPLEQRRAMLLETGSQRLKTPSPLFSLLRDADLRDGMGRSRTYYEHAMEVAHAAVTIDGYTGRLELAAVEELRGMLLRLLPAKERPSDSGADATPPTAAKPEDAIGTLQDLHTPAKTPEELFAELDELVGLEPVKRELRRVADLITVERLRRERDLPVAVQSRHLVFTGNPGTGKTTVARLVAQLYRALGVVERGHLVETDRAALVAGFIGQTAARVTEVVDAAADGVLLIDEAYALIRGDDRDFGREAVDTLVKLMEDRRDRLVVIVAGYPREMDEFINANPGLRSRFARVIHFPDYSTDELVAIFEMLGARHHYELSDGGRDRVREHFDAVPRGPGFGNGRLARNLFEEACALQASRLVRIDDVSREDLMCLTAEDIPGPDALAATTTGAR